MTIPASLVLEFIKVVVIFGIIMNVVPVLIYLERKICGFIQDRIGPNRVGPFGLFQPLADAIKLIFKQDIIPKKADKVLFVIAPLFVMIPAALSFAVIPVGKDLYLPQWNYVMPLQVANLHVGVLFFLAIGSLSVYGITFGGWASNNKYSLLGGVRSSAQMVSYEVAMGLAVIAVLMSSGSLYLPEIVQSQTGTYLGFIPKWHCFHQPLACIMFIIAAFAETNRLPFDLPEAESELVAGYHTEYSSMKFAMFFMGEYIAMIGMSAMIVTLFFGGWTMPGLVDPSSTSILSTLLSVVAFSIKVGFFLLLFIWIRWTLPRFRYDQLMKLGWKYLVPLGILNILATGIIGYCFFS
ncbi:MAG: NADH-quinone oxidoreductase subunit NuoH [Planctomycetota bacterium]|nr:MAG: NADH-quinone oxidoreductase subunit NuoH [Planctomycetota bacterium]